MVKRRLDLLEAVVEALDRRLTNVEGRQDALGAEFGAIKRQLDVVLKQGQTVSSQMGTQTEMLREVQATVRLLALKENVSE